MRPWVIACLLGALLACRPDPTGAVVREHTAVVGLQTYFEFLARTNNGLPPRDWAAVNRDYLDRLNNGMVKGTTAVPLESNYLFVVPGMSLNQKWKGEIILLRSTPLNHPDFGLGRYGLTHTNGSFASGWISETDLRARYGTNLFR